MIVDFHIHYTPAKIVRPHLNESGTPRMGFNELGPEYFYHEGLYRLDRHVDCMDAAGVDMALLSSGAAMDADLDRCRLVNDELAKDTSRYSGRLVGLAHAPATEPAGVAELVRCREEYGYPGAALATRLGTHKLDHPSLDPFYAELEASGMFLFVHPALRAPSYASEIYDAHDLYRCVGREHELVTATLRLIWGGVFDRHPGLQIVMSHLGGGIAPILDRIRGYGERTHMGVGGNPTHGHVPDHPLEYYFENNMYFDTGGLFGSVPAIRAALIEFPEHRIVFGSDYPAEIRDAESLTRFVEQVRTSTDLPASAIEAILHHNSAALFESLGAVKAAA
jgi:predicted TIM-barrel fold metal-dependent hydrolase